MKNLLWRLFSLWVGGFSLFIFVLIFPLHVLLLALRKPWSFDAAHRLNTFWGRMIFLAAGVRLRTEGRTGFDPKGVYVFVANHSSYFDIPVCNLAIPNSFRFMGKAELNKVPFFGYMFRRLHIPVNRGSTTDAFRSFVVAGEKLKEGRSVCLYPEATIPDKTKVVLGRFKNGAFRLAIDHGVYIVPMTIIGADKAMPDNGKFFVYPGKIRVVFGEPISTQGMLPADADALSARVYRMLYENLTGAPPPEKTESAPAAQQKGG